MSECDLEASILRRPWPNRKKKYVFVYVSVYIYMSVHIVGPKKNKEEYRAT